MGSSQSHQRPTSGPSRFNQSNQQSPGSGNAAPGASFRDNFQQRYGVIPDNFNSIQQVQDALRGAGLESSNLIVGIDFTKSNEWTGKRTFGGKCLHAMEYGPNPYEQAIRLVGETLSSFDEDNLIPCFGFGDVSTHDTSVFAFNEDNRPCNGIQEAILRYREIAPHVKLSGPTSFAPIIESAARCVEESGGQYHLLLIIADGQVTRGADIADHQLSEQEHATMDAIVAASNYALSIVLVGVGDGPWDVMGAFDNSLPDRNFDNFQFVDFNKVMAYGGTAEQRAARFALASLMEIPFQFKACSELGILGKRVGRMPPKGPLPPPPGVREADARRGHRMGTAPPSPQNAGTDPYTPFQPSAPAFQPSFQQQNECPVCLVNPKDTAFQCGHQVCGTCSNSLQTCPICRQPVGARIRLYG